MVDWYSAPYPNQKKTPDGPYYNMYHSPIQGTMSSTDFYPQPTPGYDMNAYSAQHVEISLKAAFGIGTLEGEPPLFDELGINFEHIKTKSLTVLNPFRTVDKHIMDDTDLAGPVLFCLMLGSFLLFSGKIHFGYIYGVAMLGCFAVYFILNLMSENGIDGGRTTSVLGYCLLPMVLLSTLSIFVHLHSNFVGISLGLATILWSTYSSSTIFVTVLGMKNQRILIAYPIGLLYTCFALMTVF